MRVAVEVKYEPEDLETLLNKIGYNAVLKILATPCGYGARYTIIYQKGETNV